MPTRLAVPVEPTRRSGSLSKQKGANFERKMCTRLSVWASKGQREDLYWRSAMSGGRATLQSRKGRGRIFTKQAGDISAIHPMGHFLLDLFQLECKFLKDLKWELVVYGRIGTMSQIWWPTFHQARRHGREPLILCRMNNRDELCMTTQEGMDILKQGAPNLNPTTLFYRVGAIVFDLRELLLDCDPDVLRRIAAARTSTPVAPTRRNFPGVTSRRRFPA